MKAEQVEATRSGKVRGSTDMERFARESERVSRWKTVTNRETVRGDTGERALSNVHVCDAKNNMQ